MVEKSFLFKAAVIILFLSSTAVAAEQVPNFYDWPDCHFRPIVSIIRINCYDREPVNLADNIVVQYLHPDNNEDTLFIWITKERSRTVFSTLNGVRVYQVDKFVLRFYRGYEGRQGWVTMGSREFVRGPSNENQWILAIDPATPFGKEYADFLKKYGVDETQFEPLKVIFRK